MPSTPRGSVNITNLAIPRSLHKQPIATSPGPRFLWLKTFYVRLGVVDFAAPVLAQINPHCAPPTDEPDVSLSNNSKQQAHKNLPTKTPERSSTRKRFSSPSIWARELCQGLPGVRPANDRPLRQFLQRTMTWTVKYRGRFHKQTHTLKNERTRQHNLDRKRKNKITKPTTKQFEASLRPSKRNLICGCFKYRWASMCQSGARQRPMEHHVPRPSLAASSCIIVGGSPRMPFTAKIRSPPCTARPGFAWRRSKNVD